MGRVILRTEGLRAEIGGVEILRGVSIELRRGEVVGLLGPNGAGKTTTIRSILGLVRITGGRITLEERDITVHKPEENPQLGISWAPEDRKLIPFITARENLLLALTLWGVPRNEAEERIEWMKRLVPGLAPLLDRPAGSLSGGQQKLVAVARALIVKPKVALLDEPMEGLSVKNAGIMADVIKRFARETGAAILVAESNLHNLRMASDRIYRIERGETLGEVKA